MATGLSLHVGINQTDPAFGMDVLHGCVKDAEAMFEIASANGFWTMKLLDEQATFDNVANTILWAASVLNDGDIFLFTFAGHGSTRSNETVDPSEDGLEDQTILLRDCVLVDNFMRRNLWTQFKAGVRVLGIADSCHSGSVLTAISLSGNLDNPVLANANVNLGAPATVGGGGVAVAVENRPEDEAFVNLPSVIVGKGVRGFSGRQRRAIETLRPEIHQRIRDSLLPADTPLNAKVLSLAACQDNEDARDGPNHGVFTQALLDIWNGGAFTQDYDAFIKQINNRVNSATQHPGLRPRVADEKFVKQRPFTIPPP